MSLLDDIREQNGEFPRGCSVGVLLDKLDVDDREDLEAALADNSIKHTVIAKVLCDRGLYTNAKRIGYHRNGGCGCDR